MVDWILLQPGLDIAPFGDRVAVTIVGLRDCGPCAIASLMAIDLTNTFENVDALFYRTERSWWPTGRPLIAGREAGVFPTVIGSANGEELFRSYGAPREFCSTYTKSIVGMFAKRGNIHLVGRPQSVC